ncbi:hypothetical protein BDN72DRAFT_727699, partial [Pluteus cervinus]
MAYSQSMSPQSVHQHYRDVQSAVTSQTRRHISKQRFVADLSQCLFDFVIQLLPTTEEMAIKEDVRKLLERLIRTIEPDSRLLSFGSTANGFSLRNSDMDLCCLIDSDERLSASDLVTMLGDLLERETKFHVKPLPHARIPIVKLSLDPSPGLPLGIACDIGFENRLALENTRLLMCYAMIDPTRVRTMVLFLKVWSKRRKINSPYKGTLSSYGYVLLVIYFLVHVKSPPVLPNLQHMPPLRPISKEDTYISGYNTWFFDDIDLLRQRWHSDNTETVAELLIDFFRYYSRDFSYNTGVASIRAGLLKKESKGWQNDLSSSRYNDARERNRFCIEDPFETDYNVSRCVTKDGLYTIRGEFMRASRILASRPERAIVALADLCEERKDEELISPPPYAAPRLSNFPPQTPYTVGSQPMRQKGLQTERLSPPTTFSDASPRQKLPQTFQRHLPDHMAPKRGKWTSPPPPDASMADHSLFEAELDKGLELATSSMTARERDLCYHSSSSNSEIFTDEEHSDAAESDEIRSVHSMHDATSPAISMSLRRASWYTQEANRIPGHEFHHSEYFTRSPLNGRLRFSRPQERGDLSTSPTIRNLNEAVPFSKSDLARRSISNSRGAKVSWPSGTPIAVNIPLPPSPDSPLHASIPESSSTVFYQTNTTKSPRLYPTSGSHSSFLSQYPAHQFQTHNVPHDIFPPSMPSLTSTNSRGVVGLPHSGRSSAGPETPTPFSHRHSLSGTTITAPTPPPLPLAKSNSTVLIRTPLSLPHSGNASPSLLNSRPLGHEGASENKDAMSPQALSLFPNDGSPTPSSTGYATSMSRSPSPHSPPPTAVP